MRMSSGLASKIRGLATWLDSGLSGRCLRGPKYGLPARQYWESEEAIHEGSNLHLAILYIMAAVKHMPGRTIAIIDDADKFPLVLYTDASQDANRTRIGAEVLIPGKQPRPTVCDIPNHIVQSWGDLETSVNQAELFAGMVVGSTWRKQLRNADVLWFIDNRAANCAMVKSASPPGDDGQDGPADVRLDGRSLLPNLGRAYPQSGQSGGRPEQRGARWRQGGSAPGLRRLGV